MHSVIIACTITTLITTYIYIAPFKFSYLNNCIVQLAIVGDIVTVWARPLIAIERAAVWSSNNDPLNQARLGAVSSPHSGDWLLTIPVASGGLGLSNEAVRVAVGLRLGL